MFTGLVQNLGTVIRLQQRDGGLELMIRSALPAKCFKKGASIAVDGVCLTVETYFKEEGDFCVFAVPETLKKTTLNGFKKGQKVNLEAALTLNSPLGGHLASGHVDSVGVVLTSGACFTIQVPQSLLKFFPAKGSVLVNGVSLTIADQKKESIEIALIPETLSQTNLGLLKKGDGVNLEVDLIARYLERLLTHQS